MENILKQIVSELQGFRNEVSNRFGSLENRFDVLEDRFDSFENCFDSLEIRFDSLENRFDVLEKGQNELKEAFKHNATLLTENFTDIRKDLRMKNQDTQAVVNLLFKEVEGIKKDINYNEN